MQNKFEFIPRRDFALAADMEFGKIDTRNLSTDAFVIKENFYLCLLSRSSLKIAMISYLLVFIVPSIMGNPC